MRVPRAPPHVSWIYPSPAALETVGPSLPCGGRMRALPLPPTGPGQITRRRDRPRAQPLDERPVQLARTAKTEPLRPCIVPVEVGAPAVEELVAQRGHDMPLLASASDSCTAGLLQAHHSVAHLLGGLGEPLLRQGAQPCDGLPSIFWPLRQVLVDGTHDTLRHRSCHPICVGFRFSSREVRLRRRGKGSPRVGISTSGTGGSVPSTCQTAGCASVRIV
jgi:hypothetical protein